ncbi:cupin [Actinopolyspora erythraea]|uniref:Cupin n=1 Tax=Actinopolyspora erythraea TaxID=414996 RepID=A0A099D754_9ACTN|nr:cupin [Actinopolyspora erythraea]ASU78859.1 cupin [Actinopolyspora erythraea]KGI81210.1 cupin [Actinopolyspora erythraea]
MTEDRPIPLPGAIGISHVDCYDWPTDDGLGGGSPHVHLACTEAYVVTRGEGVVQTLSTAGYREDELSPGVVVWFEPGTVHRMVGHEALRVTVLMQNSGLPEAGDAVFTFPPEILADPGAYAEAAALPRGTDAEAAARRRRDLAVTGYLPLRDALRSGDPEPLREFHRAAAALVSPQLDRWKKLWRDGALASAERTGAGLDALTEGDVSGLASSRVRLARPSRSGGHGMCGWRDEYEIPGTTVAYGGE